MKVKTVLVLAMCATCLQAEEQSSVQVPSNETIFLNRLNELNARLGEVKNETATAMSKVNLLKTQVSGRFDKVNQSSSEKQGLVSVEEVSLASEGTEPRPNISVVFKEELGTLFDLTQAQIDVDGKRVLPLSPTLVTDEGQVIFEGVLTEGEQHTIRVVLGLQGERSDWVNLSAHRVNLVFVNSVYPKPNKKTVINLVGYQNPATNEPLQGVK